MSKKKKIVLAVFILIALILTILLILLISFSNRFKVEIDDVVNVGTKYQEAFTATFRGKDVTKRVKVVSNIFDGEEEKYQLTFIYNYKGKEYILVKTIEVKDIEAPSITLVRGNEVTLVKGQNYDEPGFRAMDNYDGDVTSKIAITGEIDNNVIGKYTLTYTVTDSSKNKHELKRVVNVVEKLPTSMDLTEYSLNGFYTRAMVKKNNADSDYTDNILIIGDKSVASYATYGFVDIKNIWYSDEMTLNNALTTDLVINGVNSKTTLLEQISNVKSKNIVLYFGYKGFNSNYLNDYRNLIREIKNRTNMNIIVVSLLPTYKASATFTQKIVNDTNYFLLEMCNQEGLYFLNAATEFKNNKESNYLTNELDLSKNGQQLVFDYIENYQIKRK